MTNVSMLMTPHAVINERKGLEVLAGEENCNCVTSRTQSEMTVEMETRDSVAATRVIRLTM